MSPHWNKHNKTKEGYLIACEDILELTESLPREFYRLDINQAESLLDSLTISGRAGFEHTAREFGLNTDKIKWTDTN